MHWIASSLAWTAEPGRSTGTSYVVSHQVGNKGANCHRLADGGLSQFLNLRLSFVEGSCALAGRRREFLCWKHSRSYWGVDKEAAEARKKAADQERLEREARIAQQKEALTKAAEADKEER